METVRDPQLDGPPAEKPESQVLPLGLLGETQGLLGHVGSDLAHRPPHAPPYPSCASLAASIQGRTALRFSSSASQSRTPLCGSPALFMASSRVFTWASSSFIALMRA